LPEFQKDLETKKYYNKFANSAQQNDARKKTIGILYNSNY